MVIKDKDKFYKYLFWYRSLFFLFTKFSSNIDDNQLKLVIDALNIKGRKKRIYFVINELCNQVDEFYKDKNICVFCNSKCICHRKLKLDYVNGCCRKCRYQSNRGCMTKNFACKMFNCSYVKNKYKTIEYNDLCLLKVLTPIQRMIIKRDYFSSIDEVTNDLCFGLIYSLPRLLVMFTKILFIRQNIDKKQ